MAKNVIVIQIFVYVDTGDYHDKCQIIISFKFKGWLLLLSSAVNFQWGGQGGARGQFEEADKSKFKYKASIKTVML